ncbi:MAG TPA: aldo/keto reductase [Candidatus Methylomirabilis sp.]|nr:aldo/keto reductase [Candidatus Methylomirabilis sp.]
MRTRQLGYTDLQFSVIGLGSFAMGGGGWRFSWGPQDDEDSIRAILRGVELGVNWIDTAPVYGFGHSEEVVGAALKRCSRKPRVATKCGSRWDSDGNIFRRLRKTSVREEAEASLRRLGVDVIDLYQIHWPQPEEEIEEGWDAMAQLVKEGKVRYLGVSNFSVAQMKRLQSIHPVASLQPPYSLLRRDIESEILPFCSQQRIGVIPYSPMQKGLLTGKFSAARVQSLPPDDHRRNDPMFAEPQLGATLQLIQGLERLAREQRMAVAELALAWVLRRPEVTGAIVGARRPEQIEETAGAAAKTLSPQVLQVVEELLASRAKSLAVVG